MLLRFYPRGGQRGREGLHLVSCWVPSTLVGGFFHIRRPLNYQIYPSGVFEDGHEGVGLRRLSDAVVRRPQRGVWDGDMHHRQAETEAAVRSAQRYASRDHLAANARPV